MAKAKEESKPVVDLKSLKIAMTGLNAAVGSVNAAVGAIKASGTPYADRAAEIAEKIVKRIGVIQKRIDPDAAAKREAEKKKKKIAKMEAVIAALKEELGG